MTQISAAMVKELRDKTGAGMMDCKQALIENNGDIEASIDWLRKKGLSKAAKKAGRVAAEGLIGVAVEGRKGAVVEVNSETDFVARNAQFQEMVREISKLALQADGDLARLLAMPFPGKTVSVEDHVKEMIATIGENMGVRRTATLEAGADGVLVEYVHNRVAEGMGKIGVLVALESTGDKAKLAEFGRQIAMHVAAAAPLAVSAEDLDPAVIERERKIYEEQAAASGKPADIVAKMAEGRLRKEFFQQVVLLQQTFVIDGKSTVEQAVKEAERTVGAPIKITGFVRYALGEGIERKETDFAAEVAAAVSGTR
jgi:elongation factor Ts|nr:MAG: elongation factor Ts [Pseudomonadota bacterium]